MNDEAKPMPCDLEALETAKKKLDLGLRLTPTQLAAWLNRPAEKREPPLTSFDELFEAGHA